MRSVSSAASGPWRSLPRLCERPLENGTLLSEATRKRALVHHVDRLDGVEGETKEVAVPADPGRVRDRKQVEERCFAEVAVVLGCLRQVEQENLLEARRRQVVAIVVPLDHQQLPLVNRLQLSDRDRAGWWRDGVGVDARARGVGQAGEVDGLARQLEADPG